MGQTTEVKKEAAPAAAPALATEMSDEATGPVPQKINWGGIVKGALIITAVVVVGFVGFHLLSGIATSVLDPVTGSTVARGAVAGLGGIANWLVGAAGTAFGAISGGAHALSTSIVLQPFIDSAWNGAASLLTNFTSMFSAAGLNSAQAAMAAKFAGWTGAAIGVQAAIPAAKAMLADTHALVPDTQAMLPSDALPPDAMLAHAKGASAHSLSEAAHHSATAGKVGYHAAEEAHAKAPAGSWQAKVGERPTAMAVVKAPPAASHADQVKQDAAISAGAVAGMNY